jgi:hypothetical protein
MVFECIKETEEDLDFGARPILLGSKLIADDRISTTQWMFHLQGTGSTKRIISLKKIMSNTYYKLVFAPNHPIHPNKLLASKYGLRLNDISIVLR